ncbi:hypothetical protein CR513_39804, partial [Mucuna pruriens]
RVKTTKNEQPSSLSSLYNLHSLRVTTPTPNGHRTPTKKCWGFKHKVQDLIDGGWLSFEENGPNVNNNPLPAHDGLSINVISHEHYGAESVEARGEDKSRKREVKEDEIIFDSANLVEEGSH